MSWSNPDRLRDPRNGCGFSCEWFALSTISISMIVCVCNAIREGEVRAAAAARARLRRVSAYAALGCEPQCGCCLDYAQEVIDEERPARSCAWSDASAA